MKNLLIITIFALFLGTSGTSLLAADLLDGSSIIMHYHGQAEDSYLGYTVQGVGDVNGDGYSDIAASSSNPKGTYIFFGGNPVDSTPDMFIRGLRGALPPIDLDGDGIDDLVVNHIYKANSHDQGRVYFYKGYGDSLASEPYDSIPEDTLNYGFECHAVGYVDDDNLGDLLIWRWRSDGDGEMLLYKGCPELDKEPDWSFQDIGFRKVFRQSVLMDYNSDSHVDICLAMPPDKDTFGVVNIFTGPNFSETPDMILGHPIEIVEQVPGIDIEQFPSLVGLSDLGDINNDGWGDLSILFSTHGLIYLGGPEADTVYDYELSYLTGRFVNAGDLNDDGGDDLISYGYQLSSYHNVDVYYGGDIFDTQPDALLTREELPRLLLFYIGYQLSSAGDFNGDGYGDFLFSCQNFAGGDPGDIFVINGGWDYPTSIDDNAAVGMPTHIQLKQNYPNPFNPTTTIEFDIPRRSHATLSVYNVLGELVITLVDEPLGVGHYRSIWDGRDASGNAVSSGVYLYRLDTGDYSVSRKMMLLK